MPCTTKTIPAVQKSPVKVNQQHAQQKYPYPAPSKGAPKRPPKSFGLIALSAVGKHCPCHAPGEWTRVKHSGLASKGLCDIHHPDIHHTGHSPPPM